MQAILIVDDDGDMRITLSNILKDKGYKTIAAADGERALQAVEKDHPHLVLLDIKLPGMDGMRVMEKMRRVDKDLMVIMLTAFGDIKGAVKAMKIGAYDYITKPFDNDELVLTVKKALEAQYLSRVGLRKRFNERIAMEQVIGESERVKEVLNYIRIIAPTDMTMVIEGESGTGKEIIANMIHRISPRRDKPFVAIDCGAIPETLVESELFGHEKGAFSGAHERKEGRFEQADRGTLFLDEINNLPLTIQMKLLRVLQERRLQHLGGKRDIEVDVRIIVATNIELAEAVKAGRFRVDLFHRLNEFRVALPPLRERKKDIPALASHFLDDANQEFNKRIEGFSAEVMEILLSYHWPGNIREMRNVVRRAVLLTEGGLITPTHLSLGNDHPSRGIGPPGDMDKGTSLHGLARKAVDEIERGAIRKALAQAGGNKTKAARLLKIDRTTLYFKIKELKIE
ncbi:MAG: sigma-54-dependent Fis family transcriptional regulator [Deltaproteobacteria bacterium]|nr:sigma-54-dependent Fis family transcriptional regulator [Deltaproteobacteria bacterium]